VETWKTPFDGSNRTQAGSLFYIGYPDCRAMSQSHPEQQAVTTEKKNIIETKNRVFGNLLYKKGRP
jgi:hypothetical protein